MNKGILLVISGPSGVGKGTIMKRLFEMDENLSFSVSVTTRKPREGEIDGVDYYFLTREQYNSLRDSGGLLEYADFSANSYGTPKTEAERALNAGRDLVLDIEIQGAKSVRRIMPDALLVYIVPPSFEELKKRLEGRGSETEESMKLRLDAAIRELSEAPEVYDCFVVNDCIEHAADEIEAILRLKRMGKSLPRGSGEQILKEVISLA
ncbi:MAG TPA: guanylate kinase [Oscillospiraceae bacterium]|nr:guanylate kinase [Oscillospiraceae bacterium]